ncbi:hypothetical protein V7166_21640 [Bacillus thuringiensis]
MVTRQGDNPLILLQYIIGKWSVVSAIFYPKVIINIKDNKQRYEISQSLNPL